MVAPMIRSSVALKLICEYFTNKFLKNIRNLLQTKRISKKE